MKYRKLNLPSACYICKKPYTMLHNFYDQLCPECAEFNYMKRKLVRKHFIDVYMIKYVKKIDVLKLNMSPVLIICSDVESHTNFIHHINIARKRFVYSYAKSVLFLLSFILLFVWQIITPFLIPILILILLFTFYTCP